MGAARPYRAVFALVGWITLVLQLILMVAPARGWGLAAAVVNYFSFFTILTNVLVALALTAPLIAGDSRLGRWSASEGVRAAVAMYIVVVGVVYHLLIAPFWNPTGLLLWLNLILHYLMPAAFVLDWLLFTPKGRLRWVDPVKWLAFPLAYGGWTLIHGLTTHWWPYGFVDVDKLGLPRVAAIFGGLLLLFLVVGLAVTAVDRTLGRAWRDSSGAAR